MRVQVGGLRLATVLAHSGHECVFSNQGRSNRGSILANQTPQKQREKQTRAQSSQAFVWHQFHSIPLKQNAGGEGQAGSLL